MAIFHLSAKPIQRSKGRSATASAAYRAAEKIQDDRTGEIHDYTKKGGVYHSEIITPNGKQLDREKLWNMAELAEKRKDGTPAREYEASLPAELRDNERLELARELAQELARRQGCAVDFAVHAPNKAGDQRNHHVHLLCTTRKLLKSGELGLKCDVELSDRDRKKKGLAGRKTELESIRQKWEELANNALARAGKKERVDHRSLKEQGVERRPEQHMGPTATAMERKGKNPTRSREPDERLDQEKFNQVKNELELLQEIQAGIDQTRQEKAEWQEEEKKKHFEEVNRELAVKLKEKEEKEQRKQKEAEEQSKNRKALRRERKKNKDRGHGPGGGFSDGR